MSPSPAASPWRTLARFLLRALFALVILAILWSAWYGYAARSLARRAALHHQRGEPVTAHDLLPAPLPPSQDAREIALAASRALALTPDEDDLVNATVRPTNASLPLSPADMTLGRAMLAHRTVLVENFRRIRQYPNGVWPVDIDHISSTKFEGLAPMRAMANYFRASALVHHQDHQDDLALEDLRDIRSVAALANQGRFLIHHLVGIACDVIGSGCAIEIAPDLEIQSPTSPQGIPREQLSALIRELLDCTELQNGFIATLHGERVYASGTDDLMTWRFYAFRPLYRLDLCRVFDIYDTFARDIAGLPAYGSAIRSYTPVSYSAGSNLDDAVHVLSQEQVFIPRAIELHYRMLVERQAAALRLAIRLYQFDHENQIPPDLAALVPVCLPALPPDLFRRDSGPFHYDPTRRLFYSVGPNQIDDGGATFPGPRIINWNAPDAVIPLDRIPPLPLAPPPK